MCINQRRDETYDDSLGKESGKVVVVVPANTLNCKSNVSSRDSVVTKTDLGTNELGLALLLSGEGSSGRRRGGRRKTAKVLLSKLDKGIVLDTTGTDKDGLLGQVVGLDVVDKVVTLDALDVFLGSENGAAKRLALEGSGVEVVENNFLAILSQYRLTIDVSTEIPNLLDFLGFPENDITLTLNGRSLELGVLENIGKDIDSLGDIGVEGLGIVDSVFPLYGN